MQKCALRHHLSLSLSQEVADHATKVMIYVSREAYAADREFTFVNYFVCCCTLARNTK